MIYTLPGPEIARSKNISPWRETLTAKISVDIIECIAFERVARGRISAGEVIEDILSDHFAERVSKDKVEEHGVVSSDSLSRLRAYAVRQNLSDDEALQKTLAVMEAIEALDREAQCLS